MTDNALPFGEGENNMERTTSVVGGGAKTVAKIALLSILTAFGLFATVTVGIVTYGMQRVPPESSAQRAMNAGAEVLIPAMNSGDVLANIYFSGSLTGFLFGGIAVYIFLKVASRFDL